MVGASAGLVTLAVTVLWIAYLVPHELRHRHQMLESRADDRFSEALRVLAVADRHVVRDGRRQDIRRGAVPVCAAGTAKRSELLGAGQVVSPGTTGGRTVDRPQATKDRITAQAARRAAQQRAAHAAVAARRAAAARRRAVLAGALLALTVLAWAAVAVTPLTGIAGAVPTVALGGVLVLGRRAVLAGQAAELAWQHRVEGPAASTRAAASPAGGPGRAVHPSDALTEVLTPVQEGPGDDGRARAARVVSPGENGTWTPVPVPVPTYTMKPAAPHREPVPLLDDDSAADRPVGARRGAQAGGAQAAGATSAREAPSASTVTDAAVLSDPPRRTIDLDAVLARRRVAGE